MDDVSLSLFLAQLLGTYFIIAGAIILTQRKTLIPIVYEFGDNRALIFTIALVELAAGLAIAIAHPVWTPDWRGIVTLTGWIMIAESMLYVLMPFSGMRRFIRFFNKSQWYISGGFISIVIGTHLAGAGFGFF